MQLTLKDIFTKEIKTLLIHLTPQQKQQCKFPIGNPPRVERYKRVVLSRFLRINGLLNDKESEIVNMKDYQAIMVSNSFDRAYRYLSGYDRPFLKMNSIYDDDFPAKFYKDGDMIATYISSKINHDEEVLKIFLRTLEELFTREWVIDILLGIHWIDVNDYLYKNLSYGDNLDIITYDGKPKECTYIDDFVVLTYIGEPENFKLKFKRWLSEYNHEHNGDDLSEIISDYKYEIIKYYAYIPGCKKAYSQLKEINLRLLYEGNLNEIMFPLIQ